MSSPHPLPPHLTIPDISVKELRSWSLPSQTGKPGALACCLPLKPNDHALPTLYLRPPIEPRECTQGVVWDVAAAGASEDDMVVHLNAQRLQATPFTITWNGSLLNARSWRQQNSVVQFTLLNTAGTSSIHILRLDRMSCYSVTGLKPMRHHDLRSDDILALPSPDGSHFFYYSFRQFIDLMPGLFIHERYQFLRILGAGSYGEVYLAKDRRTGSSVAVKRTTCRTLEPRDGVDAMRREVEHLRAIKATGGLAHVCEIMDNEDVHTVVDTPYRDRDGRIQRIYVLHMAVEFCEGGSLREFVKWFRPRPGYRHNITEPETCYIAQQLFRGLQVLHEQNLIHRDLKPDNILIRWTPEWNPHPRPADLEPAHDMRNWTVKLADFGEVRERGAKEEGTTLDVGTSLWYPPELDRKRGAGKRTHKSDVWTAGYIIAALLLSDVENPIRGDTDVLARSNGYFSGECTEFMINVLAEKPKHRSTTKEALNLSWLSTFDPSSVYRSRATSSFSTDSDDTDLPLWGDRSRRNSGDIYHGESSKIIYASRSDPSNATSRNESDVEDSKFPLGVNWDAELARVRASITASDTGSGSSALTATPAVPEAPPPPVLPYQGPDAPVLIVSGTLATGSANRGLSGFVQHSTFPSTSSSSTPQADQPGFSSSPFFVQSSFIPSGKPKPGLADQDPSASHHSPVKSLASARSSLSDRPNSSAHSTSRNGTGGRWRYARDAQRSSTIVARPRKKRRPQKMIEELPDVEEEAEEVDEAPNVDMRMDTSS